MLEDPHKWLCTLTRLPINFLLIFDYSGPLYLNTWLVLGTCHPSVFADVTSRTLYQLATQLSHTEDPVLPSVCHLTFGYVRICPHCLKIDFVKLYAMFELCPS